MQSRNFLGHRPAIIPMPIHLHLLAAAALVVSPASRPPVPRTGRLSAARMGWPSWPTGDSTPPDSGDEAGKFYRHSELQPGCGPLGVLVAGLGEDELEALAVTIEQVYQDAEGQPIAHVPIAVIEQADLRKPLRDVLALVKKRDSELPALPARPRVPLVMLSGFSSVGTSAAVRALGSLGLTGGTDRTRPMFAVAVPRALDKPLSVLLEEIEGDHMANRKES